MLKVVLDTNVIVSTLHFGDWPRDVLDLARRGRIQLVTSSFILQETEKVSREKFQWEEKLLCLTLTKLKAIATIADSHPSIALIKEKPRTIAY
jgi:putative PIN family toxin of toxin-antitoxin system